MVTLFWRWKDSDKHEERQAPYTRLADAKAQAEHDVALAEASDDYTSAPTRIVDARGKTVWTAPIPAGR